MSNEPLDDYALRHAEDLAWKALQSVITGRRATAHCRLVREGHRSRL